VRRGAVAGLPVVGLTRADLDLTDPDAIATALDAHRPSLVINAAAFTAVDRAERERLAAFAVNATAVGQLAAACAGAVEPASPRLDRSRLRRRARSADRRGPAAGAGQRLRRQQAGR
jgi:hypothetical protein